MPLAKLLELFSALKVLWGWISPLFKKADPVPEPPEPPPAKPQQPAEIPSKTAIDDQQAMYALAKSELAKDIEEIPGSKNNPRILEYIKAVDDFNSDPDSWSDSDTAWCSCFINWCCKQLNLKRSNSGYARSWLKWGIEIKDPREGDIVVYSDLVGNDPELGHVGFFVEFADLGTMVKTLGGNQSNSLCIKTYPRFKVLGYRRSG